MLTPITAPNPYPIDPDDPSYWSQVRSHFITETGHCYLNNASLGMPPKPVVEAVASGFRRLSENPTGTKRALGPYISDILRPALAQYLGADTGEIALTRNATESLYDIVNCLDLQPGDEILTTTQEHPSTLKPLKVKIERLGITFRQVSIPSPFESADQIVGLMRDGISDRTRVMMFCHVTRGGYLYPVKQLSAMAAERDIIVGVDGAQAIGMMDVDLHDLGCDMYANSLHKWFLGPSGTGFLFVRQAVQDRFRSLYVSDMDEMPGASRYETQGTYDLPTRAALGASLDFLNRIGIRNIEKRLRMLSNYLKDGLQKIPQVCLLSPTSPETSSPGSTIFEIEGINLPDWVELFLDEANLHVDDHTLDNHRAMRISTHYYVSTEEIDRFLDKLRELIDRHQ